MQSSERARYIASTLLQAMSIAGQNVVAERLGIHETTLSKMKKTGELEDISKILAALDVEVTIKSEPCEKAKLIAVLRPLAELGIKHIPPEMTA